MSREVQTDKHFLIISIIKVRGLINYRRNKTSKNILVLIKTKECKLKYFTSFSISESTVKTILVFFRFFRKLPIPNQ